LLFNSFVFLFLFLPITYGVFWVLRSAQSRYVWLAVTGYIFYGYWNPRFCLLMALSTAVSYLAGLGFLKWKGASARRLCLIVPISVDLALLGFFKYFNFMLESVRGLLALFGSRAEIPVLDIVLPVGISFYTFHTITYIVDSYRGTIRPTKNLFEFAAYVSLFSQLVAGPIVRFRQIEGDLESLGTADRQRWLSLGVSFFIYGLVEKVVVADTLARFINPALGRYEVLSTGGAWLAMLGYTFQLYFDFCGYSDMAIGLGFMFGLRIPQNFNSPYRALDISEFWRRWHISLSTCLRDYLYIPLGGNRYGPWMTLRNLLITMLLGGLWHGANWTFVAWGAYHGLLLIAMHRWSKLWSWFPAMLRQFITFVAVVIGWVFFRSDNFGMALDLLRRMLTPTAGELGNGAGIFSAILILAGAWAIIGPNAQEFNHDFKARYRHSFAFAAAFATCVAIMAGGGSSPFLYFQF
jgi:alginate O-acetyltransferase complex protein AlgI